MKSRSEKHQEKFIEFLKLGRLIESHKSQNNCEISESEFLSILDSQIKSRLLDYKSRELKNLGKSFYTIGSSGHEGNAVLGNLLNFDDMAFLHYRSGAFFIERSKLTGGHTLWDMLLSFCAKKDDPISGGRHKVLGGKDQFIPPQTSTISSHLPKAVGFALGISRAKSLETDLVVDEKSIVLCNLGDASLNHSTAQGAINSARWATYQQVPMPILFLIEDNGLGISVRTPEGYTHSVLNSFKEIKYFYCDGTNLLDTYNVSKKAIHYIRSTRKPAFLHMKTTRLFGHAGSDIESAYLSEKELKEFESKDPLFLSCSQAVDLGFSSFEKILKHYDSLTKRIEAISKEIIDLPILNSAEEIIEPIENSNEKRNRKERIDYLPQKTTEILLIKKPLPMGKLINLALKELMETYKEAIVFGEDVAKKGGVYNITSGLVEEFGAKRVFNTLLDETTILGSAIGLSHHNILPVPEIQFLAYLHNAGDQIRGEASSLSFFSNGQFSNGMVVRIAGLAYQKGFGGHFHNDNSITMLRDIPGIILACPSNGEEAVKLLRECFYQAWCLKRVVLFLEPIALYNTRDLLDKGDDGWLNHYPDHKNEIKLGDNTVFGQSKKYSIITYGNGNYLVKKAIKSLKLNEKDIKVINLLWLVPLNISKIYEEIKEAETILIVDEGRERGSLSEQIISGLVLKGFKNNIELIVGKNSFIPLGDATKHVLPSFEQIKEKIIEIVNG